MFNIIDHQPGTNPVTLPAIDPRTNQTNVTMSDKNTSVIANVSTEDGAVIVDAADSILTIGDLTIVPGALGAGVQLFLHRPDAATDPNNGPSTIDAVINFDPNVLTFLGGQGSTLLGLWYGKIFTATLTAPGQITIHIGTTKADTIISTFDNQRVGGTPADQTEPFPLGTLNFNVIGALGSNSPLTVQSLAMKDANGADFSDNGSQGGAVDVAGAPNVYFGNKQATVISTSPTSIHVLVPRGDAVGAVDVWVEDPNNANSLTNFAVKASAFTYIPTVFTLQGTLANISTGANLGTGNAYSVGGEVFEATLDKLTVGDQVTVLVDGKPSTGIPTVIAAQTGATVRFTVPPSDALTTPAPSNAVDVSFQVTSSPGSQPVVAAAGLTYVGPTISNIAPTSGTTAGGTAVTVNGFGFLAPLSADLGGTALTSIAVANGSYLSFTGTTAAHADGVVSLNVTNGDLYTATLPSAYTYQLPIVNFTVASITNVSTTLNTGTSNAYSIGGEQVAIVVNGQSGPHPAEAVPRERGPLHGRPCSSSLWKTARGYAAPDP